MTFVFERFRLGAAVLVVVLALAAASASAATLPAGFFGANGGELFYAPQSWWPAQLSKMQHGGINMVRSDAEWNWVEPNPPVGGVPTYYWGPFDATVTALAQHNMSWYPVIVGSAPWAASQPGNTL